MKKNTIAMLGGAAIIGLLLTGCAGGQSKNDACKIFSDADQSVASDITSAMSTITTDPSGASKALSTSTAKFETTLKKITNEDISSKAADVTDSLKTFSADIVKLSKQIEADPTTADTNSLMDSAKAIQDAESTVVKACNS